MSEHPGITQRPPAFAELLVDSLDRYPNGIPIWANQTTSSDWRTNFQQNVLYGYFTRLAITQIQFFWNLPTIIGGYNDEFSVTVVGTGAGNYTININQEFYTPDGLAAAIQAALVLAAPAANFTCVFVPQDRAFNIQTGAGSTFQLNAPVGNAQNRCFITCGFFPNAVTNDQVFGIPTMLASRFIDIVSANLTKYQRVKDSTTLQSPTISNIIARVYPAAPNTRVPLLDQTALRDSDSIGSNPFVLCIDYNTPKHIKWSPDEALANFDLQLRDDFGELVPWSPSAGCEYQLTILASES